MNILFVGDPHLKITRFDLALQFLAEIEEIEQREQPDLTVFLGDVFDTHAVLRAELLSEWQKYLLKDKRNRIHILGNHEMYKPNDSKYHALQTLKKTYSNYIVVDKVCSIGNITFIPYMHFYSDFPMETKEICVAHQTFIGADYGYTNANAGVDADKVSADIIISGHVHKRQQFGKVVYPGSSFAQGINDIDQDKGVMMFDTDTYKYRFIESSLPKWRGIKLELNQICGVDDLTKSIEDYVDDVNHWIVDIEGPRAEVNSYLASKQFKKLKKYKKFRVRPKYTDIDKKIVQIKSVTASDIVIDYINTVYDGAIPKDDIRNKALELLSKVK